MSRALTPTEEKQARRLAALLHGELCEDSENCDGLNDWIDHARNLLRRIRDQVFR